jgi:hypothetical protein
MVNQLPNAPVTALYVNPVTGHIFVGFEDRSTWTSVDRGATWSGVANGSTAAPPTAFAADPEGQIFVGYGSGQILRGVP